MLLNLRGLDQIFRYGGQGHKICQIHTMEDQGKGGGAVNNAVIDVVTVGNVKQACVQKP